MGASSADEVAIETEDFLENSPAAPLVDRFGKTSSHFFKIQYFITYTLNEEFLRTESIQRSLQMILLGRKFSGNV